MIDSKFFSPEKRFMTHQSKFTTSKEKIEKNLRYEVKPTTEMLISMFIYNVSQYYKLKRFLERQKDR